MTFVLAIPLIMLGGSIGAISRFLVQNAVASWTRLPGWCGIMLINIIGSFLIGLFVHWINQQTSSMQSLPHSMMDMDLQKIELSELLALCAVGFCGAFTTFSSFSLDNYFLAIEHRGKLFVNVVGTVVLCFIAVYAGWGLGGALSS